MRLRNFFYLRRNDRSLLLFFLVLGLVALAVIVFTGEGPSATPMASADSLGNASGGRGSGRSASGRHGETTMVYATTDCRQAELFPFDPNTADSTTLLRLGLSPWQVKSIYHYRARGGVYRRPLDFARLYGLTKKQYRELEPYITISDDYRPAAELYKPMRFESHRDTSRHHAHKLGPRERIDVNGSDTTALKRVPGIGSFFARRTVRYRERLGGFYSLKQLREIEDFPEEALAYLDIVGPVRKMNVNKMTLAQLKRHPYINFYQAKDIIDYRRLRGKLKSLDDLRLLKDFTKEDIERLKHYVDF